jgi:hypothetical protein
LEAVVGPRRRRKTADPAAAINWPWAGTKLEDRYFDIEWMVLSLE